MTRFLISAGALACAAAVAAGAFGAHGLQGRLSPRGLDLWETAAKYLVYGGVGTVLAGLAGLHGPGRALPWAGAAVFSGTVFALALGGPRWLGAVTPLGATLMIAGFVLLAWGAWRL